MRSEWLFAILVLAGPVIPVRAADGASPAPASFQTSCRRYESLSRNYSGGLYGPRAWSEISDFFDRLTKEGENAWRNVITYDQLVGVSRLNFGDPLQPPYGGLSEQQTAYYRTNRAEAWRSWWRTVGSNYAEQVNVKGRRNPDAWKLVVRDQVVSLPDYKILIPEEWEFRTSYRAGDYGGIQTEAMILRRTKTNAMLVRATSKATGAKLVWEQWQDLSTKQADDFAFAVAYAIDHPWWLRPKGRDPYSTTENLEGRSLSLYYPGFRYQFGDLAGKVWWNDDPWHWKGETNGFMDTPGLMGSVCLLFWRCFPDNPSINIAAIQSTGWKAVKMPDAEILQLVAGGLALGHDIVETLWDGNSIGDKLETLGEFGSPEHIAAINNFEAELSSRVKRADAIIGMDSNKNILRSEQNRLLETATKAKAAIRSRSSK